MLTLLPNAPVLHIGIYRDRVTLQPVEYYSRLPSNGDFDICYVLDPSIATGGTALATIEMLKEMGAKKIVLICIIAGKSGVKHVLSRYPDVEIHAAALDSSDDGKGHIVPGLGDVGDRAFNTINY